MMAGDVLCNYSIKMFFFFCLFVVISSPQTKRNNLLLENICFRELSRDERRFYYSFTRYFIASLDR